MTKIDKSLIQMTGEVRDVNIEKGWRETGKTYGDFIALLHTEVDEALEAFRVGGLDDLTGKSQAAPDGVGLEGQPVKPEGVGSEFADVLIRYLDTCDVLGIDAFQWPRSRGSRSSDWDPALAQVPAMEQMEAVQLGLTPGPMISFGDHMAWLNRCISQMWMDPEASNNVLRALVTVARKFGVDLMWEYERKLAFNRTREHRHGGKRL